MKMADVLHQQPIPTEMRSPPFGATICAYEDHTTVELPYMQGGPIIVLHGEVVKVGLTYNEQKQLILCVTREKIGTDAPTA